MKIKLKGLHDNNRKTSEKLRGRSYEIGVITASVTLSDDGLTLVITDKNLAKKLAAVVNSEDEDTKSNG